MPQRQMPCRMTTCDFVNATASDAMVNSMNDRRFNCGLTMLLIQLRIHWIAAPDARAELNDL